MVTLFCIVLLFIIKICTHGSISRSRVFVNLCFQGHIVNMSRLTKVEIAVVSDDVYAQKGFQVVAFCNDVLLL